MGCGLASGALSPASSGYTEALETQGEAEAGARIAARPPALQPTRCTNLTLHFWC